MKKLIACAALATVTLFASAANAATFNFSFGNIGGAVDGTVSGTIQLADGDGTFAATSVSVTHAPDLGYTLPLNFVDPSNGYTGNLLNEFTVSGGVLTSFAFVALNNSEGLALVKNSLGFGVAFLNEAGTANYETGVLDGRGTSITIAPSPVPLPAGFPLLAAGLAAFGLMKRRQRAAS